jgi:PIN domain nuclease of toxin-antitoxin system
VRYLLDTHILVWAMSAPERLSERARTLLADESNELFYSAISFVEGDIKQSIHPEVMLFDYATIEADCERAGLERIELTAVHAGVLATLPLHHRNPFDRLLLSQAMSERMRLITADRALLAYGAAVEYAGST